MFVFEILGLFVDLILNAPISGGGSNLINVSVKNFRNNSNMNIINPHVHLLGDDAAAIAYIRITQFIDK